MAHISDGEILIGIVTNMERYARIEGSKIKASRNNNIILGLGANYSKIKFEDIFFDEFSVKIKLGLNTVFNNLIFNINYGNRFNNTLDIKGENFVKISLDLTLGEVYQIK